MSDQITTPRYSCHCGTETFMKKDGSPWKHETPQGAYCFGSQDPEVESVDTGKTKKYTTEISVYPNPELLEDHGWQVANLRLATNRAIAAGFQIMGEAKLKKKEPNGRKLRLIFEVPVKES